MKTIHFHFALGLTIKVLSTFLVSILFLIYLNIFLPFLPPSACLSSISKPFSIRHSDLLVQDKFQQLEASILGKNGKENKNHLHILSYYEQQVNHNLFFPFWIWHNSWMSLTTNYNNPNTNSVAITVNTTARTSSMHTRFSRHIRMASSDAKAKRPCSNQQNIISYNR